MSVSDLTNKTVQTTGTSSLSERCQAFPRFILEPSRGWFDLQLGKLWEYRELLYFLVWRDVKVRYKQAVLGVAWAILQPFMIMLVFTVFLGYLANVPSDNIPYPIFTFVALLPWQLFANSLSAAGTSLVINQDLIKKVYFPRLIIPFSAVIAALVDFGMAFTVLLGLMYYYGFAPTIAIFTLPLFIFSAIASALAVGLWLSALNVKFRDVPHTLPFLTQFWLFITPVAYPTSLVPEEWRLLYGLNPMVGVVDGFRWALLGQDGGVGMTMVISMMMVASLLIGGLFFFRRMESTFADII